MKKYLDAEEFKEKVKKEIKDSWTIERLIDDEPGVHIATEIDEIIGNATRYDGADIVAFSNQYIVDNYDEVINTIKSIYQRNGGEPNEEHD